MRYSIVKSLFGYVVLACGCVAMAVSLPGCDQSTTAREENRIAKESQLQRDAIDCKLEAQKDAATAQKDAITRSENLQVKAVERNNEARQETADVHASAAKQDADAAQKAADLAKQRADQEADRANNAKR